MPVSVKVGGAWKTATAVYNKVGGAWKTASDMPVKIGGVWKTGILESGAFESIATITGDGSSNSVTFSSIPQTYTSLQIRCFGMVTLGISTNTLKLNFNGDTGNNYAYHSLIGNGSTASTETGTNQTTISNIGQVMGSGYAPAPTIIDIHDYKSTSRNKTVRCITGTDGNISSTSFRVLASSGLWMNTNAITSITVALDNGSLAFTTSSVISLYGIKG